MKTKEYDVPFVEPREGRESLVGGYEPEDLIKSVFKPPQPVKTEPEKATRNTKVLLLVIMGIVLFAFGLIVTAAINGVVGFLFVLIAGLAVTFSVFAPLEA